MKIDEIENAIRIRWAEMNRTWSGTFQTMKLITNEEKIVRIGINENEKLCVIVELDDADSPSDSIEISSGLSLSVEKRVIGDVEGFHLIVSVDKDSELVYSAFLADFVLSYNPESPRKSFNEIYKKWRKKWSGSRKPISPQEEEGLVGEISVFLKLLETVEDVNKLVESWVGPFRSTHDFESNRLHVEIKTTTRDPPVVYISKIEQLAPRENAGLDLLVIQVDVVESGSTLPDYVNSMLMHPKLEPFTEELLERLEKVGYNDKHRLHYTRGFMMRQFTLCHIDDKTPIFPPELLGELPSTVSDVKYNLHINGLSRLSMNHQLWSEMASMLTSEEQVVISPSGNDDAQIITLAESSTLERKETIWFESKREGQEGYQPSRPGMVSEVIRAVAGMLNTDGGTLLIGLHDDGTIIGLGRDKDLAKNYDNLELWLTRELQDAFGKVTSTTLLSVRLIEMKNLGVDSDDMICRIDIQPSPEPVIALVPERKSKSRVEKFFMRDGNGTQSFDLRDAVQIARRRWR